MRRPVRTWIACGMRARRCTSASRCCASTWSTPLVLDHLLRLAERVRVAGKQIHDANIVATMLAYDISDLLTHNTVDFVRYSDWITVIAL